MEKRRLNSEAPLIFTSSPRQLNASHYSFGTVSSEIPPPASSKPKFEIKTPGISKAEELVIGAFLQKIG